MRRLSKVKGSGNPLGVIFPQTQGIGAQGYASMMGSVYPHFDDFPGTVNDADEWAPQTSLGTGGATITFASSMAVLSAGTATAASVNLYLKGAQTAGNNIYNVPFRATFFARISTSAGAGVAPTGGLNVYMGVMDTGETHIARYNLNFATAGSSSLASPVINMETRAGSTAAAFINSSAVNVFNTAVSRTATSITGYTVEVTHRGVTFAIVDGQNTVVEGRTFSYTGGKVPRIDLNYIPFFSIVPDGTAGYTQTASVYLEVDAVRVEQFSHYAQPHVMGPEEIVQQSIFTYMATQVLGSATTGLATTGPGKVIGFGLGSTATAGLDLYVAMWDASANGSSVYDFSNNASAAARLIWYQQVLNQNSAGVDQFGQMGNWPVEGIPFYRGLVIGTVAAAGTSVGNSALNIAVTYKSL